MSEDPNLSLFRQFTLFQQIQQQLQQQQPHQSQQPQAPKQCVLGLLLMSRKHNASSLVISQEKSKPSVVLHSYKSKNIDTLVGGLM